MSEEKQKKKNEESEAVREELRKEDFFGVFVKDPKESSPNFQLTWCVYPKAAKKLLEKKALYPFLMVTFWTRDRHGEIKPFLRDFFPLGDGMAFIYFEKPAKFEMTASIVWVNPAIGDSVQLGRVERMIKKGLDRKAYYSCSSLHDDKSYRPDYLHSDFETFPYHEYKEVEIVAEKFAKETDSKFSFWLNLFYKRRPRSSWDVFKRKVFLIPKLFFAFLFYLPVAILLRLVRVALVIMTGHRLRVISWKYILRPFKFKKTAVFNFDNFLEDAWWVRKGDGKERDTWEMIILCPFFHLIFFILSFYAIGREDALLLDTGLGLKYTIATVFVFFTSAWMFFLLFRALGFVGEELSEEEKEAKNVQKKEEKQKRYEQRLEEEYEKKILPLTCELRQKTGTIDDLPQKLQKNWGLRLKNFFSQRFVPIIRE